MSALVCTTIVLLGIVYWDLRPKWQSGDYRALWVSVCFVLAGYVILALAGFEVELYSPLRPLIDLVSAVTGETL